MPISRRKSIAQIAYEIIERLPRCTTCNQLVLSTVDKSKGSEMVEWKGESWTEENPTFMPLFPCEEFPEICNYCRDKLDPPKVGKES